MKLYYCRRAYGGLHLPVTIDNRPTNHPTLTLRRTKAERKRRRWWKLIAVYWDSPSVLTQNVRMSVKWRMMGNEMKKGYNLDFTAFINSVFNNLRQCFCICWYFVMVGLKCWVLVTLLSLHSLYTLMGVALLSSPKTKRSTPAHLAPSECVKKELIMKILLYKKWIL